MVSGMDPRRTFGPSSASPKPNSAPKPNSHVRYCKCYERRGTQISFGALLPSAQKLFLRWARCRATEADYPCEAVSRLCGAWQEWSCAHGGHVQAVGGKVGHARIRRRTCTACSRVGAASPPCCHSVHTTVIRPTLGNHIVRGTRHGARWHQDNLFWQQ